MKPGGIFISITFAQPHFRKPIYAKEKYAWSIEEFRIGDMFHYFVYVLTKGQQLSQQDKLLASSRLKGEDGRRFELSENDISNFEADLAW